MQTEKQNIKLHSNHAYGEMKYIHGWVDLYGLLPIAIIIIIIIL